MRCENCGEKLPEDAVFCTRCGERVAGGGRMQELVEAARTTGLARSAGGVPDAPETPERAMPADSAPEIPDAAPLPGAPERALPGTGAATRRVRGAARERYELREAEREAAEALARAAEQEIPEIDSGIERAGYDLDEVYEPIQQQVEERTPPPPPPAEEMWAETRERAAEHEIGLDQVEGKVEVEGTNCLTAGCVTLAVMLLLILLAALLMNAFESSNGRDSSRVPTEVTLALDAPARAVEPAAPSVLARGRTAHITHGQRPQRHEAMVKLSPEEVPRCTAASAVRSSPMTRSSAPTAGTP